MTEDRELDVWRERGAVSQDRPPSSPRKNQDPGPPLLARQSADSGSLPRDADLRRLYQPSGELARKTLGNRRLCFGVRVCRISPLDSAGNVACRDTVDSRLRRALA